MVDINLNALAKATDDLSTHETFAVYRNFFLSPGGPRTYHIKHWIQRANCHQVANIPLPESTLPFHFSGQHFKPLYTVCIICEVNDIHFKQVIFRQTFFVLSPTLIPFLIAHQTSQNCRSETTTTGSLRLLNGMSHSHSPSYLSRGSL